MILKYIDLFAGTGAFTLSFNKYDRFKCVFANDIEENSKKCYNINFPTYNFIKKDMNLLDVKKEIPEHDILCGGFNCQPFSIAGKKKGFNDPRSNTFWKIIEILQIHKPKIIILENVKNLQTHNKGETFKLIKDKLEECGYHIKYAILDTSELTGIPQHRERIYIIGFIEKDKYNKFNFSFSKKEMKNINMFLEKEVSDKYYYNSRYKVYDEIVKNVTKDISDNIIYQYRRFYVRENKSNKCPTLTANMGSGGHNVPIFKEKNQIRKLTPRECFNLQGFPSNYKLPDINDNALYKLAGNAVTVPIIDLIIKKINEL